MAGKRVTGLKLRPAAHADLEQIWRETDRKWSLAQAESLTMEIFVIWLLMRQMELNATLLMLTLSSSRFCARYTCGYGQRSGQRSGQKLSANYPKSMILFTL